MAASKFLKIRKYFEICSGRERVTPRLCRMNKTNKRMPGRPREFDLKSAQTAILDEFWTKGFSATSVDDLSKATGMVKPSLYSAFGNKFAMYLMSIETYGELVREKIHPTLENAEDIRDALEGIFKGSLDIYFGNQETGPRGCLLSATAIAEAKNHPEIAEIVKTRVQLMHKDIGQCLACHCPNWSEEQIKLQAWNISSSLHHLSTCARVGIPRDELEEKVVSIIDAVVKECGLEPA